MWPPTQLPAEKAAQATRTRLSGQPDCQPHPRRAEGFRPSSTSVCNPTPFHSRGLLNSSRLKSNTFTFPLRMAAEKSWPRRSAKQSSVERVDSTASLVDSTPEDILLDFREKHVEQKHNGKVENFLGKIKPLVNAMNRYGPVFDVASNACPEILCPPWASLRFVLNVGEPDLTAASLVAPDKYSHRWR